MTGFLRVSGVALLVVALLASGAAADDEVIGFDELPTGYYSRTEGDPNRFEVFGSGGSGPIQVRAFNPRFGLAVNAAVIFDSARPTGFDFDLGSPNETCVPPGPGRGVGGQRGKPFENCPAVPLGKTLIVGENLVDRNRDGLIDDPDDEGLAGFKESVHIEFDFSAIGTVTLLELAIIDTEEPGPVVQAFNSSNTLVGWRVLAMTGDNGLAQRESLGPTSGVSRVVIALQGSGAIDNLRFRQAPAIDVEKLTNGNQADGRTDADIPAVAPGDPVSWSYRVTNTGDLPLSNVSVTDDQGVAVSCPKTTLAVGESMTCTGSGVAADLAGSTIRGTCAGLSDRPLYENLGRATGRTPAGTTVEDTDPSHYCNPPRPAIDVEKLTNGNQADGRTDPDIPALLPGAAVTWSYRVTNTGDVALSNVAVTDDRGVAVSCPKTTLAVGESMTCTGSGVAADLAGSTIRGTCEGRPNEPLYENVGRATGRTATGVTVEDTDPSHYCNRVPAACLLELTKTCRIAAAPLGRNSCDSGKPVRLDFIYTGEPCSATTNSQGGKATCSGNPAGAQPVMVVMTSDASSISVSPNTESIAVGDLVTIRTKNGAKFKSDIKFQIRRGGTPLQTLGIHTSCSKVLRAGDQFGAMLLARVTTERGIVVEIPPLPVPSDRCEIAVGDTPCTKRPTSLGLRFNGGGCGQSSNNQSSSSWSCSGDAGPGPVRIRAFKKSVYLDKPGVAAGDLIDVIASAGGRTELEGETWFDIFNSSGARVQQVRIHTSCSQPLRVGDRFGSLEVVRFANPVQGVVTGGADVDYAYTVVNSGPVAASGLAISDVPHGPIATKPLLQPGESATFNKMIFIDRSVTNIGRVTGLSPAGQSCSATDAVTVEVMRPPR